MTLAHEMAAIGAIWIREFKIFQREKSRVVSAIATPVLWLLIVGTGFGRTIDPESLGGVPYTRFLFPGLVAQVVLFGTVFYGLYIIWDRKLDVLKEVLVAPVARPSIFVGKVVGGSTEALIQASIILLIGVLALGISPLAALASVPIVVLLAVGFVSVGLTIGSFFESLEGFQAIVTFLIFPTFFLSGALFPIENLPAWIKIPSLFNPATYAVDALRGIQIGVHAFPLPYAIGALLLFDAIVLAVGTWAFTRMR